MYCNGRRKILTDVSKITADNVRLVLDDAMRTHAINRAEIEYLYNYYRGITPIYRKNKEVRPSINHKINVNRAYEIVSFKLGYGYGEPIKYVARGNGSTVKIEKLNTIMDLNDKLRKDTELATWGLICGTGYRLVLPSQEEDTPFEIYTLHPSTTFVIYHNDVKQMPIAGVTYIENKDHQRMYTVYTEDRVYIIDYNGGVTEEANLIGIPIIEYPMNEARLGTFEPVLDLLDAISEIESNRLDDVVQFVNSFMALIGGQIDEDTYNQLEEYKMLCLPDGVDVKYISAQMRQSDIQTLVDAMYQTVLTIVGMPDRKGAVGGDTGAASTKRNGWSSTEVQAKISEQFFKSSEGKFLKVALAYCKLNRLSINASDIEIKFSRHNTENLVAKTQALATMINCNISPKVAIATSELWSDPNDVWNESKEYFDKAEKMLQLEEEAKKSDSTEAEPKEDKTQTTEVNSDEQDKVE